jgi:D-3-phosphoglycerate dehydrogenase
MHVLLADKFPAGGIAMLEEMGCQVTSDPQLKEDALAEALRQHQPDVLVVRSTKVTAPMLEGGSLALVLRAGAGYNTIDVAAASRLGIYVANCPGKNSVAVAELALGLLLSLDRRIPDNVADLRAGKWNKKEYSRAAGLLGRTLGVIGLGNIGREVVVRAHAFGMPVVAWSRSLTDERAAELDIERAGSPLEVARRADAVSVHLAQTPETRGIIDAEFFAAMKPGAFFINTSRGDIVDQDALAKAMEEKGIRAGLDVFAHEPAATDKEFGDPIAQLSGLYGTHHIGASTEQSQAAIAEETVRIIRVYAESGQVLHCVNLAQRTPACCLLTVRHRDRVGVLAHVLDELRGASINVQEMENVVFEGAEAACARLRIDQHPSAELQERIRTGNPDVLALSLTSLD